MPTSAPRPVPLSIITVVRNDRAGLAATAASLDRQTSRAFEWIVIDGASTDGCRDLLTARTRGELSRDESPDEYINEYRSETGRESARVSRAAGPVPGGGTLLWRSRPDRGPYDAMNHGLALATGVYVQFLNAGDRLADSRTVARLLDASQPSFGAPVPDMIYGDAFETDEDGSPMLKPARSHRKAWYGMFAHHQAILYRRALVADLRFDLGYPIGADYAFTLATLARARAIQSLPWPIVHMAPAGLSFRHADRGRRDQYVIRRRHLGFSVPLATGIAAWQWLTFRLRTDLPPLYRHFRCRPDPIAAPDPVRPRPGRARA